MACSSTAALAQWSSSPSSNLRVADRTGDQVQPKIKPTPDGGCYISWFDNSTGGYDVYLQRLSAGGVEQWPHNGILIADRGVSSTVDYDLITDAGGNAVITYNDDTVVAGTQQIVVQKVDPAGNLLWGAHGVSVSDGTNSFKANPHVCQLTDGTYAVAYTVNSTFQMQHLDALGVPQWANFGPVVSETGHAFNGVADIQPGDAGSFIVSYLRCRTTSSLSNKSIYAQKFDGSGNALWTGAGVSTNAGSPVVVFDAGTTTGIQNGTFPPIVADGAGGAVFGWYETGGSRNAYIQHVLANGTLKFPAPVANTGVTAGRIRVGAGLAYNTSTGEYYLASPETDASTQAQNSTFAQKFDASGNRLWGDTGATIIAVGSGNQPSFVQAQVIGDGCMVLLLDTRSATTRIVDAARVNGDSTVAWHNLVNDDSSTDKSRLVSTLSTSGFAMVAYGWGSSGGGSDIGAQNINPDGSLGTPLPPPCYPNCDGSTVQPILNVNDFLCFQAKFAAGDSYANCDGSTTPPVLNVNDFLCFQAKFAAGCR
jgi:hypothetical protein